MVAEEPPLSMNTMKWSVFIISMLTSMAGIAAIIVGIVTLTDTSTMLSTRIIPILLMIFGALVFLSSFLGCFGTVTESKGILTAFFTVLMLLIIGQVVISIIALANKGAVNSILEDAWQDAYDHHPRVIRDVEEEYACCGYRFTTDRAFPKSSPDQCTKSVEFGYKMPCYRPLVKSYRRIQNTVGIAGMVLSGVQLIALVLTYLLIRYLPTTKQREAELLEEHRRLLENQRGGYRYQNGRDSYGAAEGGAYGTMGSSGTTLPGTVGGGSISVSAPNVPHAPAGSIEHSKKASFRT